MDNDTNTHPNTRTSHTWKVVLFILLLIAIALILWWSFGKKNTTLAPQQAGNWATYICPSGKNIAAHFDDSGDSATAVLADGETINLNHTRSADGGRYANDSESFVLWEKGDFAMITHGGKTETCINEHAQAKVQQNKQEITDVVTDFGKVLQDVSLLAPNASSTIAEKYAPYVTPELLQGWVQNPSSAPGRKTSSPWPDHIEEIHITPGGVVYSVDAKIVLATSKEVAEGGNAGMVPIEMTVVKRDGKWQIASFVEKEMSTGSTTVSEKE